jgi:hypothetical protein
LKSPRRRRYDFLEKYNILHKTEIKIGSTKICGNRRLYLGNYIRSETQVIQKRMGWIGIPVILLLGAIWIGSGGWRAATVLAHDLAGQDVELEGWLIDKCCSGTKEPVGHTTECLRMESCAATGFGILEKRKDGSFKFYQFDAKGHNLAVDFLKNFPDKDNVAIIVKGIWDGNILKVSALSRKK